MLPYYAGVYAYDDPNLTPDWPANNPKFMAAWNKFNLGEWEGKAGEPAGEDTRLHLGRPGHRATPRCGRRPIKWMQGRTPRMTSRSSCT